MTATLPHDLSPIGMFMAADIVLKVVMIDLSPCRLAPPLPAPTMPQEATPDPAPAPAPQIRGGGA